MGTAAPVKETTRRLSLSQEDMALVDDFVTDIHQHAICGIQNPTEYPERKMLQAILTDVGNLRRTIADKVVIE